ncbi:MAG: nitrate reductase molybdenum cofactor assembly chaperone [Thiohalobacteraceae bacterium]|nr:nitrate reductase molybdenum cofactor assembly chaperone [Gammaproteobacteria bacterium]
MRIFQIIATLLHYPDESLWRHVEPLRQALTEEAVLNAAEQDALDGFLDDLIGHDLIDAQARHVDTFDRGRARSLYLFEHVYGESRDRGQAMVELNRLYRRHGYVISARELPDYLPLYLEFLSRLPPGEALERLGEIGGLVQHLYAQLVERRNRHAVLLEPLLRLCGLDGNDPLLHERIAAEVPDDTPAALDAVWMEAPVTFGTADGTGCSAGQRPVEQSIQWRDRRVSGNPSRHGGDE